MLLRSDCYNCLLSNYFSSINSHRGLIKKIKKKFSHRGVQETYWLNPLKRSDRTRSNSVAVVVDEGSPLSKPDSNKLSHEFTPPKPEQANPTNDLRRIHWDFHWIQRDLIGFSSFSTIISLDLHHFWNLQFYPNPTTTQQLSDPISVSIRGRFDSSPPNQIGSSEGWS